MRIRKLSSVFGVLLVLLGLGLPSATLITVLRGEPAGALLEPLLSGARLFKIGLVILGLFVIVVSRMALWTSANQGAPPATDPQRPRRFLVLTALLCTAMALYVYRLDAGLWYDEIVTYVKYARMPFGEIITTYDSQNQHILYSLLGHASFRLLGEKAWTLRLPAVLFGVGSLWLLYLLGRQVTDAREAFLATVLLAFSYYYIWFSQNARGYTGLLFWTVLASWALLRGLQHETRSQRFWLLYAVAVALGVYTHLTMLFVVAGHGIMYGATLWARRAVLWPHRWTGLWLGFCLAGLLTFQLYALVVPQVQPVFAAQQVFGAAWKTLRWTLLEFMRGTQLNFSGSFVALVALGIFAVGVWSFARTCPVLLQLLVLPVALCGVVQFAMHHPLWPRSFFFGVGFGALVVVRGTLVSGRVLAQYLKLSPTHATLVGTVLCMGLIAVSARSVPLVYGPKQDYLSALTFVEERREPGDAVVTVGLATFPYKHFYRVDWEEAKTLETLNAIRARARRTWLIYTLPIQLREVYPEIMASIERDFTVVQQFRGTLRDGAVFVCSTNTVLAHTTPAGQAFALCNAPGQPDAGALERREQCA